MTRVNAADHSLSDFSFMPIDIVQDNKELLLTEIYWVHELGTKIPSCLNIVLIYNVE